MEPIQTFRLTFHTNAGDTLVALKEGSADMDADEAADDLRSEIAGRPRWMSIENITFFSGAIVAIEVEAI